MSLYGVPFVKICEVNGGDSCMTCQVWYCMLHAMFYIFMPCFIYLCHLLYIYDMIYIFMSCFIFLCCVLYRYIIYVNFNACYITIDLCCTKIAFFCCIVFSHLCCINTNLRCMSHGHLIFISKENISRQSWLNACGAVFIPTCTCIHDHSAMTDSLLSLY